MKIKGIISLILAVSMLSSFAVFGFAAQKGDVDMNGKIEAADARLALRKAVGLEELSVEALMLADMDKDGTVTSADARLVLRLAVGLEKPEDYEEPTTDSSQNKPQETPEETQKPQETPEANKKPVDNPDTVYTGKKEVEFSVFEDALYKKAHSFFGLAKTGTLASFPKWCAIYTMNDVFRPVLKELGFTSERIEQVAPLIVVPSFLNNYYLTSEYAEYFVFYEYYDELIEKKVYSPTPNKETYEPRVGDIVFMSNKTRTYQTVDGVDYPTVDHTAQIIKVYEDGTFLCTEGSIIESPDPLARVRERVYKYNPEIGTYEFVNNSVVIVLGIARPIL